MNKHQNRPLQAAVPAGDSPPSAPAGASLEKREAYERALNAINRVMWVMDNYRTIIAQIAESSAVIAKTDLTKDEKRAALAMIQARHRIKENPPDPVKL